MTLLVLLVVMVFLALLVNIVPGDAAKTIARQPRHARR